jgi:isopentenyldiphosphate isomerase
MDDLGVVVKNWTRVLTVSYSARDPRDPKYCENELLNVLSAKQSGLLNMNEKNAYELRWVAPAEIWKESLADLKKEPIERMYAPWVHAVFALPLEKVKEALLATHHTP